MKFLVKDKLFILHSSCYLQIPYILVTEGDLACLDFKQSKQHVRCFSRTSHFYKLSVSLLECTIERLLLIALLVEAGHVMCLFLVCIGWYS